ncbi:TIGR01777 family oxidoreductase [soil metagenome]
MNIVIPGGSGQVGTLLARACHAAGHEVTVLSRTPATAQWRTVLWDAKTLGAWATDLDGADVVVNLAGKNVNCRYTPENQREILQSRVDSTRVVGQAIAQAERPPKLWLQMSTATLYAHRYNAPNDEAGLIGGEEPDAPAKWRFSVEVAKAWERELDLAVTPATRKVALRSAMIMSPDSGGIFATLLRLVRFGLGGKAGSGRQYVSWLHETDFVNAVQWLIDHDLAGVVNLSSPNPLPYADFMRVLRKSWGTPVGLPATRWMLELGTFVLGTETELVLKSRRVIPTRLLDSGFKFRYPTWPEAAEDLCDRWRQRT